MNDDENINFLLNMAKLRGVATATVKDGTMIVLDKERINAIFAEHPDDKTLIIFAKQPTIADAAN